MIEFDGIPTLSDPVMIAAFEGWNDAGESASATITHLREVWGAELITEFDSEDYYDYQVNRPDISVDSAGIRQLEWPTTRIYLARVPLFPRDVVLIQGIEPNMRWQQFTREILGLAAELDISMVVTLGALLSAPPRCAARPFCCSVALTCGSSFFAAISTRASRRWTRAAMMPLFWQWPGYGDLDWMWRMCRSIRR